MFEAGLCIEYWHLRESLLPILKLTVPDILLTTVFVGLVVTTRIGISIRSGSYLAH